MSTVSLKQCKEVEWMLSLPSYFLTKFIKKIVFFSVCYCLLNFLTGFTLNLCYSYVYVAVLALIYGYKNCIRKFLVVKKFEHKVTHCL